MATTTAPAPARVALPPRALSRTPPAGPVRLVAFAALSLWCSVSWARQVAPAAGGAAAGWTALATAYAAALIATRRLPERARMLLAVGAVPVIAIVALAICGAPMDLLRPRGWSALAGGVGQGLQALPELRVPYRGVDEWVRTVVLAGGALLSVAAAALAFWPRGEGRGSPVASAAVLGTAYAVSIVVTGPQRPFASGAVLTVLLAGLLWGDRPAAAQAPLAAAFIAVAVITGLLAAPRLDGTSAWIDPRHIADGLAPSSRVHFDWGHHYTPLDWPRDGREALRVTAADSAYWKGVSLERFDGVRWASAGRASPADVDTEMSVSHLEWRHAVTVVARDISSRQLYAPGDVIAIKGLGRDTVPGPGGTAVIARYAKPLKPGDSYRAEVYAPTPGVSDLSRAGVDYPAWLRAETAIELPRSIGGPVLPNIAGDPARPTAIAQVPFFGTQPQAVGLSTATAPGFYTNGRQALLRSDLGRVYRLARRLGAGAASPYVVVQRVLRRVRGGARYSESPPRARLPLVDFLFGAKLGYCQQFSGAMALLLRMNGVPARVAEGFAPGIFDRTRGQHVVRDFDAHSWVEVYFPRIGWVAFDPTPSSAPPASQASDRAASAATGDSADRGGDRPADRRGTASAGGDGGHGRLWLGLGVTLLFALAAGLALGIQRIAEDDDAPELAELRRALRRTGRAPGAGLTLASLEASLAGDRGAQGYVRALRLRRYGPGAPEPTAAQRAALRRALGAGLGPWGRARAWWAVPPRWGGRGHHRGLKSLRERSYTG